MASIREQHFVTYLSPGTIFHETTTKPIESWDPPMAARMAIDIVERHGARPFAFYFETCTVSDDVDDGQGGTLRVQPRAERTSGRHYLGGTLLTEADVEARGMDVLLSNMRCNGWTRVIESTRSYKIVQPFEGDDVIVDESGRIVARASEIGAVV